MAAERAKNLKKGWKEERDARVELEGRVDKAEAAASAAVRESKEASHLPYLTYLLAYLLTYLLT